MRAVKTLRTGVVGAKRPLSAAQTCVGSHLEIRLSGCHGNGAVLLQLVHNVFAVIVVVKRVLNVAAGRATILVVLLVIALALVAVALGRLVAFLPLIEPVVGATSGTLKGEINRLSSGHSIKKTDSLEERALVLT